MTVKVIVTRSYIPNNTKNKDNEFMCLFMYTKKESKALSM